MAGFLNGSFNPKDSRDTILTVAHLRWVELELCHTYPLPCSLQEVILHRMRLAGKHLHTCKNKKQHKHLNFKDTKNHLPLLLAMESIWKVQKIPRKSAFSERKRPKKGEKSDFQNFLAPYVVGCLSRGIDGISSKQLTDLKFIKPFRR